MSADQHAKARERVLIKLIVALWRELAAERDGRGVGHATSCFDRGAPRGPVREASIDCCAQVLGPTLSTAIGEDLDVRLPDLEGDTWRAFRRMRR